MQQQEVVLAERELIKADLPGKVAWRYIARPEIVSKDLSLGLRKVFDCRNLHWMTIHDEDVMCQGNLPPQSMKHYDDALTAVRKVGECKISVIMRKTGLGYNSSASLADYINHHADWREDNV